MHVGKTIKHIPQSSPCWWYDLTIPGGKKNDMVLPVMAAEDLGTKMGRSGEYIKIIGKILGI